VKIVDLVAIFGLTLLLTSLLGLVSVFRKKMQYWILSDIKRDIIRIFLPKPKGPIHIMFCFVDHFEPGNGNAGVKEQKERVDAWVERYPKLVRKHKDSDGISPQHTFFYPPHYDTHDHLERIVGLCAEGFGEVEMHLHHDRLEPWPDNELSLRNKILNCIERFSRYGVFCLPDGRKTYAFIHGDWALANSLKHGAHCGINDEISILKQTGCYADFTFPVSNEAQPKMVNMLFYGQSHPYYPKGYNRHAIPVMNGRKGTPDLMFIQGIMGIRWKSRIHFLKPSIEQSNISRTDVPFRERIDYWINKGICVQGRPEWIFVKIHGHGAAANPEDREALLGREIEEMYSYLETRYNDGVNYCLHYVSAREMYNIIKAAEAGVKGNAGCYRDFLIPRYVYLPSREQYA